MLLSAIVLTVALVVHGCCASTCESMLGECERGLEELHRQVATMCTCGLPDDDGGCELAASE